VIRSTTAEVRQVGVRDDHPRVSIVLPCLNEAENVEYCVALARSVCHEAGLAAEVIVVDNGSSDDTARRAVAAGATLVSEPRRGYGSAYLAGFAAARGDYIVMSDADRSYDLHEIPAFVTELEGGAQLVMGNRMENIQPGAMSWLHRLGNPLLSGVLNLLFKTGVRDVHCGMRALRRDILPQLDLHATGMEFASEMVIRSAKEGLCIRQVPIELHPRGGRSKLSPFRDGWRHLRLILMQSPTHLFLLPGALLVVVGALIGLAVIAHLTVFGRHWYLHALIGGMLLVVVGTQVIGLGLCARMYGIVHLREHDPWLERMQARVRLEHGLLLGGVCILAGVAIGGTVVAIWVSRGFGELGEEQLAIVGGTCIVVGVQIVFTSFLLSILGLRRPRAVRPGAHDLHAPHAVGTDARSLVDIRPGSAR
jgi:glycosyltransferase involved in cell wall biosynthesis